MKKSLLALAALSAFAGVASAQSSVTLFGILDVNVNNTKNGSAGNLKSLGTDGVNSSRLGFRGVEDLGGGLRAGFWLEGALAPDTGVLGGSSGGVVANTAAANASASPGAAFNRRATVSLLGGFGEVRLGRDYTPTFWNITIFDPFGTNGSGSALNIRSQLSSGTSLVSVRENNSIGYFLPPLGGIYGQAMVAAGETATANGQKYIGARLGYAAGPFNIAGSFSNIKKTGKNTQIDDFTTYNFGASFNFGVLTLSGFYEKNEYAAESQKYALIGVTVPFGAGTFKASAGRTGGSSDTFRATQIAVGYQYDLSKRTALYTNFANIKNKGNSSVGANFAVNFGPSAGFKRGETSTGYQFGVRHSF